MFGYGATHGSNLCGVTDFKHHFAAEIQRTVHDSVRADDDLRIAVGPVPSMYFVDDKSAVHARAITNRDIAIARRDAAADVCVIERNRSIRIG
jgi:hypothetical protein